MAAYYNEIDPFAVEWLRELIKAGAIAPGDVDERSIEDVRPIDLKGYTQCHFFAGIGVWSYALRRAGWDDNRPIWSMSFPCQPFSSAGKGAGFADERHLWPAGLHLIENVRPECIVGEQVASPDGLAWLDVVQNNLESAGYPIGAIDTCAAGFGAPGIRQRLYWMAHATWEQHNRTRRIWPGRRDEYSDGNAISPLADSQSNGRREGWPESVGEQGRPDVAVNGGADALDNAESHGFSNGSCGSESAAECETSGGRKNEWRGRIDDADASKPDVMAYTGSIGRQRGQKAAQGHDNDRPASIGSQGQHGIGVTGAFGISKHGTRALNGFWRDADWLFCRDGQWRPVEPGTFPLATGVAARVGRLRGYGNALNAEQAEGFAQAVVEIMNEVDAAMTQRTAAPAKT